MVSEEAAREWAVEEFGNAQLGNALRTRRVVRMATRLADSPAGLVTAVFGVGGERAGAYRFLESERIEPSALMESCAQATLRRAALTEWVFVPIDGSSLTLADPSGRRELGAVGSYRDKHRGLEAMCSIGVHPDGTPLGLLDIQWWARSVVPGRKHTRSRRTVDEKETRHWLEAIHEVEARFEGAGRVHRPWFQLDRGGDFHDLLRLMGSLEHSRVTVRAAQNRRLAGPEASYMWDILRQQPVRDCYDLAVAAGKKRQARLAHMTIRWAEVTVLLRDRRTGSGRRQPATIWAMLALEAGTVPKEEKPIQWLLLSNVPIVDTAVAKQVLFGYSQRWRIEEFFRAWKSQCRVEQSQLHRQKPIQRWATLLAAVAVRIERLKYLARNEPDTPASVEFSREEIDAVIVLRQTPGVTRGAMPSMGLIVRWIADLGGYVGPSNGPPGATVLARGLQRIEPVILALRFLDRDKPV